MKITLTGALGHIGSRMIRELPNHFDDLEIVMVDDFTTQRYASLFDLPTSARYTFIEGDVTNMDLSAAIEGADAVIHLAAITDAAGSFEKASQVESCNFAATRNVAEACAAAWVRLIYPSTTSVYGTQKDVVDEDCSQEELKPQSPYAETKLKEEALLAEMAATGNLRHVTFRFGTIFGTAPGMRFHTAVNKFCFQAVMGQSLTVWSTALDQKRPYLDLSDAVDVVVHTIKTDLFDGNIYNVVTVNATVRQVVDAIRTHVPDLEISYVDTQIMNQLSYEVIAEKIAATGFTPKGDMAQGIEATIKLLRQAGGFAG
ncbi:MAG: SDR family oxidoreductase [Rhodospirillales bacterium]|nr:SDR family oxidoreductase [Rhodospirillales bacterium]